MGIPWLWKACGHCEFCLKDQENLCNNALFTGYQVNGGYAQYTVCKAEFAIALSLDLPDEHLAPLLCAGLIGFRSYRMAAPEKTLGLYGFGASAHIITQIARYEGIKVFAFTREGDQAGQQFARDLGVEWAGGFNEEPPELLDAAIIFAPAGELVPVALRVLKKGGRCICGGIHMSDIPSFPYKDLWDERSIQSVANLTREDAKEFFALVSQFPIKTEITSYALKDADKALEDLRHGKFHGAAVIRPNQD